MTARDRRLLLTVALGGMLVPLNSTMVAIALPRVVDDFDTSLAAASWLVTAYLIAMATLNPVAGKLGDRLGRRPLILGGLLWFGVASAGAALMPSLEALIAFRIQQAVAGALIFPNAIAVLREVVPAERLGGRLGLVNAALPLGAAAGPPLGGLLVALGGWRAIFLVNLPLVVVPLALGARALPRAVRRAAAAFDLTGAALLCATLSLVALTLTRGGDLPVPAAAAGGVAAALAVALLVVELRRSDPVVNPRLFGSPPFAAATAGVA
ncbi:MAG TPA: MFS transporter, partial [Solirubrobacteraceae bacterium]|nr:MFS transporter [Solirubrobacteraceae bacterium]